MMSRSQLARAWADIPLHKRVTSIVLLILLIIAISLFASSFAAVDPNFVGLDYNANTLKVDKKVYEPGRYVTLIQLFQSNTPI